MHDRAVSPLRATFSALAANLVGIGLGRFAYTPLIPALIAAEWFEASVVFYLGAANLAGYLAGAVLARPMAARWAPGTVLRLMMVLATLSAFASATPVSFWWFFAWRFVAGLTGGVLMVLAASTVLPHVPAARRGLAGGVIFTGVGLGIAASGTLVPLMLEVGLMQTWIGLGALSALLTVSAWGGWPGESVPAGVQTPRTGARPEPMVLGGLALIGIYIAYGLNAFGLVPHMLFLVDFVARGLDAGVAAGGLYWVLFGIGAMCGPVVAGLVADRIGFRLALRVALLVQAGGIGLLAVSADSISLAISSLVVGAFVPGVVPLVLGRVHELVPDDPYRQRGAWSVATVGFAIGQAFGGYGLSLLFDLTQSYALLPAAGAAALLMAFAVEVTTSRGAQNAARPGTLTRQR